MLDKDESDQLGLTGFLISAVHTYDLNNDERNWQALSALPQPHGGELVGVNLANHFSSYLFTLLGKTSYSSSTGRIEETGETERFSMSLLFGMDTDDLFRRKRTVQQIYNANYRFAKPPEKPTVKAIEGDRKVTLYWDDRAEKTFDPFYQKYNFEGYRVYRSTEPNFLENKIITDAYGKADLPEADRTVRCCGRRDGTSSHRRERRAVQSRRRQRTGAFVCRLDRAERANVLLCGRVV